MRERQGKKGGSLESLRITPAYAGKTTNYRDNTAENKDHPRVCGKDANNKDKKPKWQGSPPRMRERHFAELLHSFPLRITPAYAGKTTRNPCKRHKQENHPRVCGKDPNYGGNLDLNKESPPRMRERRHSSRIFILVFGITPAYAGKTLKNPNKIAIFPRLNSKNYLVFKTNPLLHTIL